MDSGPWLGDSAVGLLQDLVIGDTGADIAWSATLCDVAPTPRFLSTMNPGVS
jgi:hypothetical protein